MVQTNLFTVRVSGRAIGNQPFFSTIIRQLDFYKNLKRLFISTAVTVTNMSLFLIFYLSPKHRTFFSQDIYYETYSRSNLGNMWILDLHMSRVLE